jgi:hypothetical protein
MKGQIQCFFQKSGQGVFPPPPKLSQSQIVEKTTAFKTYVFIFYFAPIILSRYWNFHQSNQTCDLAGAASWPSLVYTMWEPRRLTTLWASTACYRGSFNFLPIIINYMIIIITQQIDLER